jgi:hypothetical protein
MEAPQGSGVNNGNDDTALNDAQFFWCRR